VAILISVINLLSSLISLLVIAHVILSFVMSPYHPVRQAIDSFIAPMLAPIRRIMPSTGMLDFSPMVLILVVQLVSRLLIGLLIAL
jgi:YggT family protein